MKNKLLLTTAIAGLTAVTGFAHAETKVTGNLEQTFLTSSNSATPASSGRPRRSASADGMSTSSFPPGNRRLAPPARRMPIAPAGTLSGALPGAITDC